MKPITQQTLLGVTLAGAVLTAAAGEVPGMEIVRPVWNGNTAELNAGENGLVISRNNTADYSGKTLVLNASWWPEGGSVPETPCGALMVSGAKTPGGEVMIRVLGDGGEAHPLTGYRTGLGVGTPGDGVNNVNFSASGGTLVLWGSNPAAEWADAANRMRIVKNGLELGERTMTDAVVLKRPLVVTQNSSYAVGTQDADGANLRVARGGVLIADSIWDWEEPDVLSAGTESLPTAVVQAQAGTRTVFEPGAAVVISKPDWFGELTQEEITENGLDKVAVAALADGAQVQGLEGLTVIVMNDDATDIREMQLTQENGVWFTQDVKPAETPLGKVAEAMRHKVFSGQADRVLQRFYAGAYETLQMQGNLEHFTLLGNSFGTADAIAGGFDHTLGQTLRRTGIFDAVKPVAVEIGTSSRRSRYEDNHMDGTGHSAEHVTRDSDYAALTFNADRNGWFGSLRASFEKADMKFRDEYAALYGSLDSDSTVTSLSVQGGRENGNLRVAGMLGYAEARDRYQTRGPAGLLRIGMDDVKRRAWTLGTGASLLLSDNAWRPYLDGSLALVRFDRVGYSIKGDGTPIWDVREKARTVGTVSLETGFDWLRSKERYQETKDKKKKRLKDDLFSWHTGLGVRLRAGQLQSRQVIRFEDTSAEIRSRDLGRGEVYAQTDFRMRWDESTFGLGVGAWTGAGGVRGWRADIRLIFEIN